MRFSMSSYRLALGPVKWRQILGRIVNVEDFTFKSPLIPVPNYFVLFLLEVLNLLYVERSKCRLRRKPGGWRLVSSFSS